ncbi:hypothetical protein RYX36_003974 [Vicia faba]
MFRFSHQVPNHLLSGQEAHNAPIGCRELDPAATPLDLLQIETEAYDTADMLFLDFIWMSILMVNTVITSIFKQDDYTVVWDYYMLSVPGVNVDELLLREMVSSIVCAEGSPEGIISTADIDTDVTTTLVCANVDDGELPLDYNQGNTDGSLDENLIIECLDQIQPMRKRSRDRPRKSETDDADWPEKPLLLTQGPTKNKRYQNGQTRGPGRPPRVIQDTEQCEDKLKKKEEKLRKKEEKLKKKEEELMKKDQAKLHDREEKLKKKDEAKLHDREEKLKKKMKLSCMTVKRN